MTDSHTIADMLAQGYGVEDIEARTGIPADDARRLIATLRRKGTLGLVLREGAEALYKRVETRSAASGEGAPP